MLSRSAAETSKLELLSEMSGMKLRSTALERENLELRAQLKRSEQDMITLVSQASTSHIEHALCLWNSVKLGKTQ